MTDTTATPSLGPAQAPEPAPLRPRSGGARIVLIVVLILALLATAGLAAYLWFVNATWVDQNEDLRDEATAMGEEVAQARADVADLEEQVATLEEQLGTTSDRLSELANEEANAGDDLKYLGDLIVAYASCVSSYDEVLTDALTDGFTYQNSNARSVQADVAEYCESLAEAYEEYTAESG